MTANLNPYLLFNGNCEAAIGFYSKVFDSKIVMMSKFGDTNQPCATEDKNKVMHTSLMVKGVMLMASDCPKENEVKMGENVNLSLNFESVEELENTFIALSSGGIVKMPLSDTFWGARFGMLTDAFGIHWMLNFDYPKK